ncbi:MAG TPA: hypothetical protein VEI74_05200 [Candidatus Methylomirabilis sp.]|nr:hypothetical protein [Candidatus Methylomirabilis sp.]
MALAIRCFSVGAFFGFTAWASIVSKNDDANVITLHAILFGCCIGVSFRSYGHYSYALVVRMTAYVLDYFFRLSLYFINLRFLLTSAKIQIL